ncbi:YbaY family lipoprotein [Variovorax sp. OV329]|uniref:YbaY family lipoprotein n=1 Tax=Variovorax sp. OV329 TaxID=1882825 RepID=UPI0008E471E5|nr:YbaY family lipoprotein [Variovorax sp. OV329]SFM28578.1 putative lipoprotein [Variovorax sp. OV329]
MKLVRRTCIVSVATGAALLLSGCTLWNLGTGDSTPGTMQTARVTGTINWRERMAVPPDATVTVRLQDVSRMDAPAVVMSEQRFTTDGRQPPLPFELAVDAAKVDPNRRYTVAARVEQGGQLLFINDTAYPVLTQGGGYTVHLVLVRAAPGPR